jgi:hypothetical protein
MQAAVRAVAGHLPRLSFRHPHPTLGKTRLPRLLKANTIISGRLFAPNWSRKDAKHTRTTGVRTDNFIIRRFKDSLLISFADASIQLRDRQ